MSIPEYIIKAAREYSGNNEDLFNAFIAGFKATRQPKTKNIVLSVEQEQAFEQCWESYGRKGNKAKAKQEWSEIPATSMPVILAHIKAYVGSREKRFQKDFERYLKDGEYNKIVFNGNLISFDPLLFDADEYTPKADGIFQRWNPVRRCLEFNGYISMLDDGYNDDNRPDGATIASQQYEWRWSKEKKEWIKKE